MDTTLRATITLDNQISSGLNKIEQDFSKLNKSVSKAVNDSLNKMSRFGDGVQNLGKNISLKLTAPLVAGLSLVSAQAINQVKQVQNASAGLRAYEKDAGKVTSTLQDLVKFAQSDTGVLFQRQDLFDAASTLKMYGNETETLVDKVKILSKGVAMGKTTFQELSTIIGRVGASGKLTATDFDMLIARGIGLDKSMRGTNITTEKLFEALDKVLPAELLEGRANTIEGQMIRLQSALRNVGASFLGVNKDANGFMPGSIGERIFETVDKIRKFARSEEFLDAVKQAAERVGRAFDFISAAVSKLYKYYKKLSPEQKKLLTDIVLLAAVLGPVLIAVGGFIKLMVALLKPVLMVGGAIFKLGAFILAINPIILGIIAIGVLLWKNWDWISLKAGEMGDRIKGVLSLIRNLFLSTFNFIGNIVKMTINGLIWAFQNWHRILGFVLGFMVGVFVRGFIGAFNLIKNVILSLPGVAVMMWDGIKNASTVGWANFRSSAINGINWTVDRFREIPSRISGIWNGLRDGFNSRIGQLHNSVSGGINWIVDRFRELPSRALNGLGNMFNVGKNAMAGFWRGLLSGLGKFAGAVMAGLRAAGVPGLASGTNFAMGGSYLVGETGPELVTLPRGAKVTRSSETNDMMKGQTVNITINNPTVRNDNDIQMLVQQVTQALDSNQRLKRLGV
jgi:hypothetical protein